MTESESASARFLVNSPMAQFRVLGPLVVMSGEARLDLSGQQQQLVLALLLAEAGKTVSTEILIDEIWGETPPASARKAVQSYVANLRTAVNLDGEILLSRNGGYVIDPGPDAVDAFVFEREAMQARGQVDQSPAAASERLRKALSLWHGDAYDGLAGGSPSLQAEAARLEELRLAAIEARVRADLACGDPGALVAELEVMVSQFPLRERLRSLLMIALYRSGRQADALGAYQDARVVLAEQIGIEPSAELQDLERRILEQDPSLSSVDPLSRRAKSSARRNPYKGLRAFEEADTADFFGRRDLVDRVIQRLRRRDSGARFVALAGPSGSGKSSVLRAGIVPTLRAGKPGDSGEIVIVSMYPGRDPMAALVSALGVESLDLPLDGRVVLIVDQFEEAFTLAHEGRRGAFFDVLADAVGRADSAVQVIITIRADFLDQALLHPGLASLLDHGLELVAPLSDREVTAAIVQPAKQVGTTIEPPLVAEMVREVVERPATLPLLQYVLTDLFEESTADVIGLAEYQASGSILGALTRRAEESYMAMNEVDQYATREVYLRLVTIGDQAQHLRRRVTRSELAELPLEEAAIERVLSRYGDQRLLSFDRNPLTGESTVEVPHESLLREWPRLREWIETSRAQIVTRQRLDSAVSEWLGSDQDSSYTARGALLGEYEQLATDSMVVLTSTELDYIEACRAVVDAEQKTKTRRRRLLVSVLASATAVSLLLAGFAITQSRQADDQRREADEQRLQADVEARTATARELAAASVANLDADPQRSLLLALAAIDTTRLVDESVLREAEDALHQAVQASRLMFTLESGPGAAFVPNSSLLATTTFDGSVRLWDALSGEASGEFVSSGRAPGEDPAAPWPLVDLAISADGSQMVAPGAFGGSFESGYPTTVWGADVAEPPRVIRGYAANITSTSLSADGSLLAIGGFGADVTLWNLATDTQVGEFTHLEPALAVSLSPNGSQLAVASGSSIFLWDVATQMQVAELQGHDATVRGVNYFPDGQRIVSASIDGTARIWDLASGTVVAELRQASAVRVAVTDRAGELVATGADDGSVSLWDASSGVELLSFSAHATPVTALSFNDGGSLLATSTGLFSILATGGASDKASAETRVWDVGTDLRRQPLTVPSVDPSGIEATLALVRATSRSLFRGPQTSRVVDIALSPSGTQMAVSSVSGQVTLWDTATGSLMGTLVGHGLPVTGISYDPTENRLATSAGDGVRIWDPVSGRLLTEPITNEQSLRVRSGWYTDVEFSPDGQSLAVTRADSTLSVVDASTGDLVGLRTLSGQPTEVVFSPDGSTIATGSARDAALVVEAEGGVSSLLHDGQVDNLAFSPDGRLLVTVSGDGKATMWRSGVDGSSWMVLYTIESEDLPFRATAFSPSGDSFATGGDDGAIRIWDAAEGSSQLVLQAHNGPVLELDYGPDDTRLASISSDGTAKYNILDLDETVAIAESKLTRTFTEAECRQYLHQATCASD